MKKLFSLLLAMTLLLAIVLPVQAASANILDEAELMTDSQRSDLEVQADGICSEYDLDVIILTVDSLDGKTAQRYAEDHYDSNSYDFDGILLLVAMSDREWYILTNGKAAQFFGDWELDRLEDAMLDDLSDGDYYDAFSGYLTAMESCLDDGYAAFEPDYSDNYGDDTSDSGVNILVSLVIGAVVAGIAILIMRSGMNTAKPQSGAAEYIKAGSYRLTEQRDMFLYSRVTKIPKPQNNGSSGSRSGGSRSSGGGSRGGRGGKF